MNTLINDIKYAFRMLRKRPGFTAIALITLAIGIGANTIMFSVVNVLALRPAQVEASERLAECMLTGFRGGIPYALYTELRQTNPVFQDLVAHGDLVMETPMVQAGYTRSVSYMFVSPNYFPVLGVTPLLGRFLLPEEESCDAPPVGVISYQLWKLLGGDETILNQNLLVEGLAVQIVGVTPPGFSGTSAFGPDIWVPLGCHGRMRFHGKDIRPDRVARVQYPFSVKLLGRLKPGLDHVDAQAQLQGLVSRVRELYPDRCQTKCAFTLTGLSRLIPGMGENNQVESMYLKGLGLCLMAVSGAVLMIACLNLANMLVIQGAFRHKEIAIRMAIGGGRFQIVRQFMVESLLLALTGGMLGVLVAFAGYRVLNTWVEASAMPLGMATSFRDGFDSRTLLATLVCSLIASVLFGLKPALRLSGSDVVADLKESGHGLTNNRSQRRRFMPRGLSLACQIALSVVLVMGGALFTRGALKALWLDHGYDLDHKIVVKVDPKAGGYDTARSTHMVTQLVDHLSHLPGVETVSVSEAFPLCNHGSMGCVLREFDPATMQEEPEEGFHMPSASKPPVYGSYRVDEAFFKTMDIPILQGRKFQPLDSVPDAEKVVIIDKSLAHRLRPDGDALGCLIQYGFVSFSEPHRVIGIVPDMRITLDQNLKMVHMYVPIESGSVPRNIHLQIAANESTAHMATKIQAEIHQWDPTLPIVTVASLKQHYQSDPQVWALRIAARSALSFGAIALFLASLGIYAVKGYMVASRIPEIGLRKAIGATHSDIMGMVFKEGVVVTLIGLALGIALALGVARLIRGVLYGIDPIDPISIVATIVLLGLASLLAGYFPARRAARIDPMEALRCE